MEPKPHSERLRFASPEEELNYLRARLVKKELELRDSGVENSAETPSRQAIREYRETPSGEVLAPHFELPQAEAEGLALGLSPEPHDSQIRELAALLGSKGIKNALSVLSHMKNPHLDDDFERYLIQYIKAGFPAVGLKENTPLFKALHMTLFEVTLPERGSDEQPKTFKELVSSMEQFYAGMMAVKEKETVGSNYIALELAVSNGSDETVFYAAVPDSKKELFEKHIHSIFYNAQVIERKDDYNIFNEAGVSVGSFAELKNSCAFPVRTYESFDLDPLNALLNSFSKTDKEGEGAAIQIIFRPPKLNHMAARYKRILSDLQKGKTVEEALNQPETVGEHVWDFAKEAMKEVTGLGKTADKKKEEDRKDPPKVDEIAVEQVKNKSASPIAEVNVRLVASSKTEAEALEILSGMESAFNQFENTHGNSFRFNRLNGGKLRELLRNFSFRMFSEDDLMHLSFRELTTVFHLPSTGIKSAPELKVAKAGTSPAPVGLPTAGIMLGINRDRNTETKIFMAPEDRLRHFYTIGQTGTGKTTLLKNMIVQDIVRGDGVCLIDPHGSDILDILAQIPASRYEDVIYFDPAYTPRPMALNMLEYNRAYPEQKTFVVNELFSIFQKLYGAIPESMGPMFEQYFRNATLLVIEDPDTGSTLLDVSRVMSNKEFRDLKVSRCKNPVVVQFWREIAEKAGGEGALANIVPYITSKFDVFLANDIMRPIIAQEKSSWNFRDIMDNRKIMLVNLSKGRLGDINANLIGLIIVGKILMAALSRVDSLGQDLPPFYLYIDEFQNITTDSIATILSEARKYRLGLHIAHQFIAQLEEKIKDSVFGNVGSIAAFRVGAEDAEFLEKQFAPVFSAKDLMNLDNHNAYLKMLALGRTTKPFSIATLPPKRGDSGQVDRLKELSYLKFGRERSEIEKEIAGKYQK